MPVRQRKPMDPQLRQRLIKAGAGVGAGAIAIAGALGIWFEGEGKTVIKDSIRYYLPYIDPVGIPTVCRGITGKQVVWGKYYTEQECRTLEEEHLAIAEAAVKRHIINYDKYNRWIKASLIDFTYNKGEGNLASSTMKRKFNSGDIDGGCDEMLKWINGRKNGALVVLPGLVKRADATTEICKEWTDDVR